MKLGMMELYCTLRKNRKFTALHRIFIVSNLHDSLPFSLNALISKKITSLINVIGRNKIEEKKGTSHAIVSRLLFQRYFFLCEFLITISSTL